MYNRKKAVEYARKYALSKNPEYYFFGGIGGDCTNFVSQCLHAGGFNMVYEDYEGWFYVNSSFRSASWTGVSFFRNFILDSTFYPRGRIVNKDEVREGDIVFLGNRDRYYHSLFISKIEDDKIYVCAHSDAALDRPLDSYFAFKKEYVKIDV